MHISLVRVATTWLPLFLLFILLALISPLFTGGSLAQPADASMTVTTDELVYQPGDDITFSITIDTGGQALSGDLMLEVYPPASPRASDIFDGESLGDELIEAGPDLAGEQTIDFTTDAASLGLEPGGYPVKVTLVDDGGELLAASTWLAVVAPDQRQPLDLVMLFTISGPPERNPGGDFLSTGLLDRCRNQPPPADSLLQHLQITTDYPDIKTVYAIEPLLLDQLQDLGDGFTLRREEEVTDYPADSMEAADAKACLESLGDMAAADNTEVLSSPYAFTRLPLLAKQGWSDGNSQYRIGDDTLAGALLLTTAPAGAYAPGLEITTDSLRYMAATGNDYTVLAGSSRADIAGELKQGDVSHRIRDISGERITGFFADDGASAALLGRNPDPAAFMAVLANAYATGEGGPLLVAAAASPPALSVDSRDRVYRALSEGGWVNTLTLAEARDRYRPDTEPVTLLRYIDPTAGYLAQTYYQRLSQVHGRYEDYRAAVDSHEPVLLDLSKLLFTAESDYLAGEEARPGDVNRGLEYLDAVERITGDELDSLKIDVDTPWLQRDMDGTATITISNSAPHAFNLNLTLEGDGVELTEDYQTEIRVEPGAETIRVPFRTDGWNRLSASVSSGDTVIAEDSAVIHPISGRVWIVIIVAVAALVAGGLYYFFVIRPAGVSRRPPKSKGVAK